MSLSVHKITITFDIPELHQSEIDSFEELNSDKKYNFQNSISFNEMQHKLEKALDNFSYFDYFNLEIFIG